MKKQTSLFLFVLLALSVQAQPPVPPSLVLWYKQPANQWVEALPIGNGRLGGMVFGGILEDQIQFNEETLWTGEPRAYQREGAAAYLPQIRQLLAEGKQAEAEKLAQDKFMGRQSNEADYVQKKDAWLATIRDVTSKKTNPASAELDDRSWKTMDVPTIDGWEKSGAHQAGSDVPRLEGLDGAVWFRTSFDLPQDWVGKDVVLDLGRIRDQDFTYLNGELIGTSEGVAKNRRYTIPAAKLHVGKNQLAIQVINLYDKGGFIGVKTSQPTFVVYPEGQKPTDGVPLRTPFRYWIQDNAPPAAPRYQADYQPFGDLWLRFKNQGPAQNYRFELDLARAISRVTYTADGVRYTRQYLASTPDQAIAVHLTASKPGQLSFETTLTSPHAESSVRRIDNQTIALSVQVRNGALKGESLLHIQLPKGRISVSDGKLLVSDADEATLYLTAGTNFKNYKDVSADPASMSQRPLQGLRAKRFDAVKAAHIRDYQSYFNTLTLDLGGSPNEGLPTDERLRQFEKSHDPSLAALYLQYGRYLLISSSRPGTRPANLQGIWNDLLTPPWGSKYTTNINLEMNYWPAEMLNLSACHEPLFAMIDELVESGRKTAKAHYNARGWVLHHNTDLWRGTAPINASNHGIWVSGGAWVAHHLWEHYRYTQDRTFLKKRAYPLLKEAALFFIDFLVKDPKTGWLISTPSNSPEHGGLVAGPTMDHQLIRDLFKNCIAASEVLGTDAAFRDTLKTLYPQIAPNQIGKHGQLQEWLQDVDDPNDTHRHVSHLWGVHPGTDITWDDSPDLMKAARQSLLERGDEGTGWSLAWKINFWARFRDGNHAYTMLKLLFRPAISPEGITGGGSYPNLFDAHPPFQIDGNFGGASGIAEMLVQSQGKTIDLLPALPAAFFTGYINGLCARGGFVLNLRWQKGQLTGVDVLSKAGQPCVLRYGDNVVRFATESGKTYRLNGKLKKS